jgi:hypothetical protein
MLGEYDSRLARSKRDRAARYGEQAERFREIAKMETQPRTRARLLELAGNTNNWWMIWPVRNREDRESRRSARERGASRAARKPPAFPHQAEKGPWRLACPERAEARNLI